MPARKTQVRDAVSAAEGTLRASGEYRMWNDEPGVTFAAYEELRRVYPSADITLEKPAFGGEAVFRSTDHLGTRKAEPKA